MSEVETAFKQYSNLLATLLKEGKIAPTTETTFRDRAERFVRWMRGEYEPGQRERL